jgi:hypothetical protein
MKRHLAGLVFVISFGIVGQAAAQVGTPIFQQNFDSLTLGPSVNERQLPSATARVVSPVVPGTVSIPNAFTHTPPAGWTVESNFNNFGHVDLNNPNYAYGDIVGNIGIGNQGSAAHGVDEWEGWSFADFDFWITADTQDRQNFTRAGNSIVAVADADEYDDLGAGLGGQYYNTGLTTNNIPVAGKASVNFSFDSSWRDETFDDDHTQNPALGGQAVNNQTVVIYASFDGGTPVKVEQWHSDPSDPVDFKNDAPNERLTFPITVPGGAQNMKLTLAYLNAGNDWWWAVDNLEVNQGANPAFWSENFESVALGPSVNERFSTFARRSSTDTGTTPLPNAFTHTPPAGWNVDNALMPAGVVDDDFGVFEWEGWTFTTRSFSTFTGNTQLFAFEKSTGNYAIADSDNYFPLGSAGPLSSILETPTISLTGVAANALKLQFDSAWQDSGVQTAVITVDYGSGEVEVLRWASDNTDPDFHAENLNETVFVNLNNPAGATTAKVRFKYLDGFNDWFWAIDNIKIGTEQVTANADFDGDGDVDGADFLTWQRGVGVGTTRSQGNADGDSDVDAADLTVWKSQFGQTGLSGAVPEPTALFLSAIALAAAGLARRPLSRRSGR